MSRSNRGGPQVPPEEPAIETAGGCLRHVFAQFLGVAILAVLAILIWMRPPWRLSALDIAYAIVALAIPIAWGFDRTSARGAGVSGESAAAPQRRSLLARGAGFLVFAAAGWAAANSFHLFGST